MKTSRFPHRAAALLALLAALVCTEVRAADQANKEQRLPAAKVVSDVGVLARAEAGKPFQRVRPSQEAHSRDLLVCLPGLRADLETPSRAVRLTLWGNLPQLSDSPVLESAVILHAGQTYDLDLTLVSGRVVLTNTRKKGPARVWVRGKAAGALLTLAEPGDQVALELVGRWPPGVPFSVKPRSGDAPVQAWEVHVLKGRLDLEARKARFAMSAPPGAAYFRGDSVAGPDQSGPRRRDRLPEWADPKVAPPAAAALIRSVVDAYRQHVQKKGIAEAEAEVLALADKDTNRERAAMARELVVYARAATGDVAAVIRHLADPRHAEMRQAAVVALRHWIGGAAGRDEVVYQALLKNYTPAQAETVMQLLHSPFDAEQPEAYETLIAYLGHGRRAVRELAHWHLVRMAPAGRQIKFDPAGPAADRAKGMAQWRKLIPAGSLPPEEKEKK
jgi:hypothetical protein